MLFYANWNEKENLKKDSVCINGILVFYEKIVVLKIIRQYNKYSLK